MKKLIILSIIALASFSSISAQKNVIKANLISPLVRTGSFFYERVITDKVTVQLGTFFTGFTVSDTKFRGIGITPEFRYYASGDAPSGFYIAPFLRYQRFSLTDDDVFDPFFPSNVEAKATLTTFGAGLLVGRQWVFGERISFDMFIGPCFNAGNFDVEEGDEDDFSTGTFEGFGIRTGITVGVAF